MFFFLLLLFALGVDGQISSCSSRLLAVWCGADRTKTVLVSATSAVSAMWTQASGNPRPLCPLSETSALSLCRSVFGQSTPLAIPFSNQQFTVQGFCDRRFNAAPINCNQRTDRAQVIWCPSLDQIPSVGQCCDLPALLAPVVPVCSTTPSPPPSLFSGAPPPPPPCFTPSTCPPIKCSSLVSGVQQRTGTCQRWAEDLAPECRDRNCVQASPQRCQLQLPMSSQTPVLQTDGSPCQTECTNQQACGVGRTVESILPLFCYTDGSQAARCPIQGFTCLRGQCVDSNNMGTLPPTPSTLAPSAPSLTPAPTDQADADDPPQCELGAVGCRARRRCKEPRPGATAEDLLSRCVQPNDPELDQSADCSCSGFTFGDGHCDSTCNKFGCDGWDGGDCICPCLPGAVCAPSTSSTVDNGHDQCVAPTPPSPAPTPTPSFVAPTADDGRPKVAGPELLLGPFNLISLAAVVAGSSCCLIVCCCVMVLAYRRGHRKETAASGSLSATQLRPSGGGGGGFTSTSGRASKRLSGSVYHGRTSRHHLGGVEDGGSSGGGGGVGGGGSRRSSRRGSRTVSTNVLHRRASNLSRSRSITAASPPLSNANYDSVPAMNTEWAPPIPPASY